MAPAARAARGGLGLVFVLVIIFVVVWLLLQVTDLGIAILVDPIISVFNTIGQSIVKLIEGFWNAVLNAIRALIILPVELILNTFLVAIDGIPGIDIDDVGFDWLDLTGDGTCSGSTLDPDGSGCSGSVD